MSKCQKCGQEYPNGTKFCSECGGKVAEIPSAQTLKMKCKDCGGTMTVDSEQTILSCPYCGSQELIAQSDAVAVERIKQNANKEIEMGKQQLEREKMEMEKETRAEDRQAEEIRKFKKGVFSKVLIILAVISALFCAVSFSDGRILSGILAILMLGLSIFSYLCGIKVIKEKVKGMGLIAGILAIILIIPYFPLYNAKPKTKSTVKVPKQTKASVELSEIQWPFSDLAELLPAPESDLGNIEWDDSDSFYVVIGNTAKEDFSAYANACMDNGFDVDYSKGSEYFYAYNAEGYNLSVTYSPESETMNISLYAPNEETPEVTETEAPTEEETEDAEPQTEKVTEAPDEDMIDGMRVSFKNAMDEYEEFMNEYVAFMKKYYESDGTDLTLITDYADYIADYAEFAEAFEKWDSEEMNDKELTYYLAVMNRVNEKLQEVSTY